MSKLVTVERAQKDMKWVKVDSTFMEMLPPQFSHLECQRCTCAKFNIGVWPDAIKVGCSQCSWEISIPYQVIGEANVLLPI